MLSISEGIGSFGHSAVFVLKFVNWGVLPHFLINDIRFLSTLIKTLHHVFQLQMNSVIILTF